MKEHINFFLGKFSAIFLSAGFAEPSGDKNEAGKASGGFFGETRGSRRALNG